MDAQPVSESRMRDAPRRKHGAALVIAATVGLAACADQPETRAFVERLGADTMAVEIYTVSGDLIEGEVLFRSPVTRHGRYSATLGADGSISHFEVDWETPHENPEGPPSQRFVIDIADGTATLARHNGDEADTLEVEVPAGAIPTTGRVPLSIALWEQAVRQSLASGQSTYEFSLLSPGRPQPATNSITWRGTDSVALDLFGTPILAAVDAEGRILGASGRETTMKVEIEPVDAIGVDVARLAADFAARDARGEGIGPASPPATADATGGGATFTVNYSSPAMRGREIWGGLVPYDAVWRTGANAATHFTTDRDLVIGDAEIPAGTYTLWTTFTPEAATLIINSQTDIWGTAYDSTSDVARVALTATPLDTAVERFAIEIEPTETGGVLQLTWDRTRFSVEMRVN